MLLLQTSGTQTNEQFLPETASWMSLREEGGRAVQVHELGREGESYFLGFDASLLLCFVSSQQSRMRHYITIAATLAAVYFVLPHVPDLWAKSSADKNSAYRKAHNAHMTSHMRGHEKEGSNEGIQTSKLGNIGKDADKLKNTLATMAPRSSAPAPISNETSAPKQTQQQSQEPSWWIAM
jgi:hypothetical protein